MESAHFKYLYLGRKDCFLSLILLLAMSSKAFANAGDEWKFLRSRPRPGESPELYSTTKLAPDARIAVHSSLHYAIRSLEGCDESCRGYSNGFDYRGCLSTASNGDGCIIWESWHQDKYPNSGLTGNNYCRNPDNDPKGPWCLTSTISWEYCDVLCLQDGGQEGSSSEPPPTSKPTRAPSPSPTATRKPPTPSPVSSPAAKPALQPTRRPTARPSHKPTPSPTFRPTGKMPSQPSDTGDATIISHNNGAYTGAHVELSVSPFTLTFNLDSSTDPTASEFESAAQVILLYLNDHLTRQFTVCPDLKYREVHVQKIAHRGTPSQSFSDYNISVVFDKDSTDMTLITPFDVDVLVANFFLRPHGEALLKSLQDLDSEHAFSTCTHIAARLDAPDRAPGPVLHSHPDIVSMELPFERTAEAGGRSFP